jgi:hypothetical protein
MEYHKYFMEFMGVVLIVNATLFTDGNPIVMALAYYAVYTLAKQTSGHFTPIGALAHFMAGRTNLKDLLMNLGVQMFALSCAVIFFKPLKTLIDEMT